MTWVGVGATVCAACGAEAVFHVTVKVEIAGEVTTRMKVVQFWLCRSCETANQQVLAQDTARQRRIALRLTDHPSFLSHWRDWRGRKFWSPDEVSRQAAFDQEWDNRPIRERAKTQAAQAMKLLQQRRDRM